MTDMNEAHQNDGGTASHPDDVSPKKKTSHPGKMFLYGILTLIALALIGGYYMVRVGAQELSPAPYVVKAATVMRLSIGSVNGQKILFSDYAKDYTSLKTFFSQPREGFESPEKEELRKIVAQRLFLNALVKSAANMFGVSVTNDDYEEGKADLIASRGSEEVAAGELMDQYGWTIDDFLHRVIWPLVLERKLREAFGESTDSAYEQYETGEEEVRSSHILFPVDTADLEGKAPEDAKAQVRSAAQEVLDSMSSDTDFAALAKQYGRDATAPKGGDLGWFGRGDMVAPFEEAGFALDINQVGPQLVESQFGYHIVKLTGRRQAKNFEAFMNDQLRNANVKMSANLENPFVEIIQSLDAPAPALEDAPISIDENENGDGENPAESVEPVQ